MKRRQAFTLIELLIAMALTLFMMAIITTAFTTGLDTFRALKGIGDMQDSLRTASDRLRGDLHADHFDAKKRLSDPLFWSTTKPEYGFFRVEQDIAGVSEGVDQDGLPSTIIPVFDPKTNAALQHRLHFSVKLRGNRPGDFFVATVPANSPLLFTSKNYKPTQFFITRPDARHQGTNSYNSQWAEVAYFLEKSGTTNDREDPTNTTDTPLYSLYRVQRLVVADNSKINGQIAAGLAAGYSEMSCQPQGGTLYFNTPKDLAQGNRSFTANSKLGASLLMTDVVTFQIQVLKHRNGQSRPDPTFTDLGPKYPAAFDTRTNQSYRIVALKIVMRVWDQASLQSRQITVVVDL